MCLFWRSPIAWSPEFTSGDFIFNPVITYSGILEIGTRQLNNWRLHEPPDFLPFYQPGALPTRLYCSGMPRHHSRLPGRYSNVPGRVLLTPFQNSFTRWKGRFFKICCSDLVPSALDGFPLYWVRETRALKSKPFKKLAPNDQVVCRILAEVGGFDSATLISLEFNAGTLGQYICMSHCPRNFRLYCFRITHSSPLVQVRK